MMPQVCERPLVIAQPRHPKQPNLNHFFDKHGFYVDRF